ncbi:MAG: ArpU family phage packaging/lysis transcriptional regulator [Bacillota bacterium]
MAKQLTFMLPEIDREATRKKVEEKLEIARIYKQLAFVRRETKQTPSYEPRFHGNTNAIGKPVEECSIWNVDTERHMEAICKQVEKSVAKLGPLEKQIIEKRYLESEDTFDYEVWNELGLSERNYYRKKARAIYKLAFMLHAEVFLPFEGVS